MALRRKTRRKKFPRRKFYDRVTRKLAEAAYRIAYPNIPSRVLKEAMVVVKVRAGNTGAVYKLFIPHYWSHYLHDGRGTVTPKRARSLMWFKNPRRDPRYDGGYPVRLADAKAHTLSKQEFKRNRSEMIFAKSAKPIRGKFFFSNRRGMRNLVKIVAPTIIKKELSIMGREFIGKSLMNMKVKHRF